MAYKSETIGLVVTSQINQNLFLPDIQREFVWTPDKITKLFDSIMRKYPISSFLFWKVGDGLRSHVDTYALMQDYKEGQVHISNIATDGIPGLTLVLDGQQRLTSLFIGLRGSFTVKKKWKRRNSADAWQKKHLYLDLLRSPEVIGEDGEQGLRYGFEFFEEAPQNGAEQYWLPVGTILNYPDPSSFAKFKYAERKKLEPSVAADMERLEVFETNLDRLHQSIWVDEAVAYHIETEQDTDRVLDIFVRTNDGGVQLSKSDLLLSMITANWGGINAKTEIQGLVERLNYGLVRRNDFNKDFILKTCLVLCGFNVRYKVENFKGENLSVIEQNWPDVKSAIEAGIRLINSYGIDKDTLTSANAVIPVVHYLYKSGLHTRAAQLIAGTSAEDALNRSFIRRWLITALLSKAFGRSSDDVLTKARAALDAHSATGASTFPVAEINKAIGVSFDTEDFLDIAYSDRVCFLALSLLYDEDNWGMVAWEKDHIFPRSRIWSLYSSQVPVSQHEEYRDEMNSIANLQLLVAQENAGKSDKEFETWLQSRDAGFKSKHLIPTDDGILVFTSFLDFIEAREHLIRDRLKTLGIMS